MFTVNYVQLNGALTKGTQSWDKGRAQMSPSTCPTHRHQGGVSCVGSLGFSLLLSADGLFSSLVGVIDASTFLCKASFPLPTLQKPNHLSQPLIDNDRSFCFFPKGLYMVRHYTISSQSGGLPALNPIHSSGRGSQANALLSSWLSEHRTSQQ